jgi:predicted metal-dependent enzyme (double-stranded beta helix superfamily)
VFELFDNGDAPVRAERRKDEAEVEAVAAQAAEALGVTGPATVHIRRDADGGLSVVEMTLSPCVHGPLANEVLDALVCLWERDQPA